MLRKQVVPDNVLLKKVTQRLMRAGLGAGCSVRASVKSGQVTLSGTIQRDLQRRPALRAASGIDGVRQVVDQLKVEAKKERLAPKKEPAQTTPLDAETKPTETKNLYGRSETQTSGNELS